MDKNVDFTSQSRLLQAIERRRQAIASLGPMMGGSLCQRSVKCANPECDCHRGVRRHISWQVTQADHGKTRTVYVPMEMADQVREWTENHKRARALMKEMSALCEKYIRTVVPKYRAGLRRRGASSRDASAR